MCTFISKYLMLHLLGWSIIVVRALVIGISIVVQVTVLALAKLLEHGVIQDDPRLQQLAVKGDQVRNRGRYIRYFSNLDTFNTLTPLTSY